MDKYSALKQYFGYDSFRMGQEELADSIISGRDTLGVMPTGAGKSVCYQIPAVLSKGITIVISPLISLMQDQVTSLVQAGIRAAYINSSLTMNQLYTVIRNASEGMYKLIYVAPERLDSDIFTDFAMKADISAITVDEAHCISQWGQDFRPAYLNIPAFAAKLPKRPVISAFTATATEKVREDIIRLLELKNPFTVVTGFDRRNLYFDVRHPSSKPHELKRLITHYMGQERSGIIYCSTRKNVETVCQKLIDDGFPAARYHAGLTEEERRRSQEDFIYDRVKVMVATNAFGMGIDKSNVSFVIHYNMPKDMESYYQEAGRAGRDGSPSDCILLYSGQDVVMAKFLIEKSSDESEMEPEMAVEIKKRDLKRLREMANYCTGTGCLRSYILRYFGENAPHECNSCSVCCSDAVPEDITVDAQKIMSCIFRAGNRYGAKMICSVLRGEESERISAQGLDTLTTYGIMKDVPARRIMSMIELLEVMGYIERSDGEYPVLKLSNTAAEVLRGQKKLEARLPGESPKKDEDNKVYDYDRELMEKLRAVRKKTAEIQGIPAYMVFTDAVLRELCISLPQTDSQFVNVPGVGKSKLERYGDKFMTVIREYCREKGIASAVSSADADRAKRPKPDLVKLIDALIMKRESIAVPKDDITITSLSDLLIVASDMRSSNKHLRDAIAAWLENEGLLTTLTDENGHHYKEATDGSADIGIYSERVNSQATGRSYIRVKYTPDAVRFILDNLENIKSFLSVKAV